MSQPTLSPQPQSASPVPPATHRDLQRATLRDLVSLATECAATESEIERRYHAEVEEEHKKYKRLAWELNNKFSNLREAARNQRIAAEAAAQTGFEAASAELNARDEEARRKVETRHDLTLAEVKKKYNHASWLADSVLENAQNGIAVDYKKAT